ncbi:unnamed protein product [Rotaria socialis]|uniref:AB hydrolase-1 domain-containing protein n=2 Tax=Rotaria socialis TaxID=392032 RepID=A0A818DJ61_9BILA|nr:unnamed protein product [Rotaria socialis]CAF4487245.1 unnamed protein product [Rotaria socialis]
MLEAQSYEVAIGITYEYIYVKSSNVDQISKATFLFLHGFPSSFHCWRHQIEYFSKQGYGCLAPNMMGYGKTYSPLDKDEYKTKTMVEHLIALLDHLGLDKVVVVGHDWGVRPASRFVLYYPERTLGLVLISVGYRPPAKLDLDQALVISKKAIGYEMLGYWKFFDSDDAATIMENNADSFIDLAFTSEPIQWKTDLAPLGKIREWIENGKKANRASYMAEDDYKTFRQYIVVGMQPKLNWYKSAITNVDWNDEMSLDPTIKRPTLYIGGTKDYICLIQAFATQKQYITDLKVIELEACHWIMEEKPDDVNQVINEWIKGIL